MGISANYKSLPKSTKKTLILGMTVALFIALPLFVWSIVNMKFDVREKASEVNLLYLSKCNEICDEQTYFCINQEVEGQRLTCYGDKNTATVCRNVNCPESEDCICPAPIPTPTPTPTPTPGIPNYCGGTCGSNFNCQANYYCYEGFCRNPVCPSDNNCDCINNFPTTPTATPKKTATAKSSATPIYYPLDTPSPTISPTASASPIVIIDEQPENMFFAKYALYIFAGFVLIVIATIYYALKGKKVKNDIPHIAPPVNI